VDMALGCFDDNYKYDDLVLSTLQTPSVLCQVIRLIKFCFDVTNLFDP
jgi:hypothetical protein